MKKAISLMMVTALAAALLAGCGGGSSSSSAGGSSTPAASTPASSVPAASQPADSQPAGGDAQPGADLAGIVAAVEAVNEVPTPRAMDDLYVEFDLMLTMDNIVAYAGDVTNDGADCALVFAAEVADGAMDTVKSELEAHKASASSSLYAEFADKVAKAQGAIITSSGNVVVYVIAGVNGPDYSAIQAAIDTALAQ